MLEESKETLKHYYDNTNFRIFSGLYKQWRFFRKIKFVWLAFRIIWIEQTKFIESMIVSCSNVTMQKNRYTIRKSRWL